MKVLSAVLLLLAIAVPLRAEEWNKTYTVSGKPQVRIDLNDGRIRVNVGQSDQVYVHVNGANYRIPDQLQITEQQSGNSISLRAFLGHRVHFGLFNVTRFSVEVDVTVPPNSDLDLHSADGSIEIAGVKGDLRILTGDGHIAARNVDGVLRATSGDGHITADGRFDSLELRTKDGHIEATARTGSQISTEWTLHTNDGSVDLRVPANLKADLDAHTGDGHITLNLPVEVQGSMSRSAVRGRLNGGGPLIRVRTGDGSIRIQGS